MTTKPDPEVKKAPDFPNQKPQISMQQPPENSGKPLPWGRFLGIGYEMLGGLITSFAIAIGIGHLLNLSFLTRGIIGIILATAVNTLSFYRIMKS